MENNEVTTSQEEIKKDEKAVETNKQEVSVPKEVIDEIQKKSFGYILGQMDQRLAEIGYTKPDGVKTTDFVIELLTKKNDEPDGTKNSSQSVSDTEIEAKFKELQKKYQEKEAELESVKTSVMVQKRDLWLDSLVLSSEIATPDHLSEVEKSRMVSRTQKLIKSELANNYDIKEVDGKFRFYNKDGSPVLDGTIDMNPIDPKKLIVQEFSEYLKSPAPVKTPVKGTGVTDVEEPNVERVIPTKIKTRHEFYSYLVNDLNLTMGSKEFSEKLSQAQKQNPAMFR